MAPSSCCSGPPSAAKASTIVFNKIKHDLKEEAFTPSTPGKAKIGFYQVTEDVNLVHQVSNALYRLNIQSVMVEGGARLLQSFIDEGMWDEARVINNEELIINNGLDAPELTSYIKIEEQKILIDTIKIFKPVISPD